MSEDQQINRRLTRIEDQIDAILNQRTPERKEQSNTVKQAQDIAALTGAALAAVAGTAFIFYAFGYLIVNSYLAAYGVRVSELTNPAYIPAGLSFVFVGLMIPAAAILLGFELIRSHRPARLRNYVFSVLTAALFSFLLVALILLSVYASQSKVVPAQNFVGSYAGFIAFLSAMVTGALCWYANRDTSYRPRVIYIVFICCAALLASLVGWIIRVYPNLPPSVGGGYAVEIQLSVSDIASEMQFKAIGISVDSNLHLTEPVKFLVDTNDAFLVLLPNGSAARIDKKLVTNFRYTVPVTTSANTITSTLPISITPTP